MDNSNDSQEKNTPQTASSESYQAEWQDQLSVTFDFEALMAMPLPNDYRQLPEVYVDQSHLDMNPGKEQSEVQVETSEYETLSWLLQEDLRQQALAAPSANHGSSSVPITISAPADEGLWAAHPYDPSPHQWSSSAPITRPSSVTAVRQERSSSNYLNPILNAFTNPSTPLNIIDAHTFPFEAELQTALEAELKKQHEVSDRELVEALEAELRRRKNSEEGLIDKLAEAKRRISVPPTPAPTPAAEGSKTPRNKRTHNIASTDPTKHYRPLRQKPESWGSVRFDTGEPTFVYTEHGELDPKRSFDVEQISEFLSQNPLTNKTFTLWIQTVPADSGRRYPTKNSDKCRFSCCPDPNRTIRKGDFRVAFDEDSSNMHRDPYHCAGYVHLYCLEKCLDFPSICRDFDVRPDTRELPEGKNKMAITRDHESMARIVGDFVKDSVPWAEFGTGERPDVYYEYTLCSKLTDEHLIKQPRHLQIIREQRGGNTIDRHRNNLDLYVEGQRALRAERPRDGKKSAEQKFTGRIKDKEKSTSNRRYEDEDDASDLDDDILQRGLTSPTGVQRPGLNIESVSKSAKRKLKGESESESDALLRRHCRRLIARA
ncbi:hypothetical protein PZA11_002085 [Diplocarpon coronariae]|uniref:Uncharacterized protein n=1 Tax=Diplocarpon coronariae TaxID=2795749 RepID=A0A218Z877_9HELO|nr:hypothetical protein JHW43_001251 [Diplocarpon mali]OWP03376.1 hypothetical protein B2J93_7394 [Marssonina coronariae]